MPLIVKTKTYADNDPIIYSDLNSNWDTLYNLLNGNLDNANIVAGAAIDPTKIAGTALTLINAQTVAGSKIFSVAQEFDAEQVMKQIATPGANPASGFNKAYFKSDGYLYKLDSGGNETLVSFPATPVIVQASDAGGFTTDRAVTGLTYTITPSQNCHVLVDAFANLTAAGGAGLTDIIIVVNGTGQAYYPQHGNNTDTFALNTSDLIALTGGTPYTITVHIASTGSSVSINGNRAAMRLLFVP